ncbi:DUF1624 domain-containing protein [Methanoplanus sp. FWC-SCC4]|uniref:DUF1624 domain-containing protein n=1 Tax=Methanochimaera problematica TaxID=2609417 RepID=A0AA97FC94_9EURY|nr:heparan-alpha-glucosaminide N-acetyltransferase [Methanoplanus sp. FWC-SCC4]WOF15872.1 DUF1624 domain-containing protein [Methanoplanus sp. FWC-SCC4]
MSELLTQKQKSCTRFQEIDTFRGIAIIMMVFYHIIFDLYYFNYLNIDIYNSVLRYFAYATASLFIMIAGISIWISKERYKKQSIKINYFNKYFKRGLFLFSIGILITIVTWIFIKEGFILFGILHLIGLSIILAPFFFRLKEWNALAGLIIVILGIIISKYNGPFWTIFLGLAPADFYSVDYEPLLPWFGIFLIGISIGAYLYPHGNRKPFFDEIIKNHRFSKFFEYPGRHSLIIYLVHQPVIIMILSLIAGKILI